MRKNLSSTDRLIRVLLALVMGLLILTGEVSGMRAIILGIVAVVLLATSATRFCPTYWSLKISTLKTP